MNKKGEKFGDNKGEKLFKWMLAHIEHSLIFVLCFGLKAYFHAWKREKILFVRAFLMNKKGDKFGE